MMAVTDTRRVGVLGATSLVGAALLSELKAQSFAPIAYSRRRAASADDGVQWRALPEAGGKPESVFGEQDIPVWVSVARIWILPQHFDVSADMAKRRPQIVRNRVGKCLQLLV